MGITWEEAELAAQGRTEWRQSASTWMRVESLYTLFIPFGYTLCPS